LRDCAAESAAVPDNHVDKEGLRRSSCLVSGDRRRCGGIAKIAKRELRTGYASNVQTNWLDSCRCSSTELS
jgi:hypothetical protein